MEDLDKNKKRTQRSRALEIARVSAEKKAKAKSGQSPKDHSPLSTVSMDYSIESLFDSEPLSIVSYFNVPPFFLFSAKVQVLQRRAVRAQIDLDTESLNKIEAMRDSHRKEAMTDLEDWRSQAEKPILENISGTVQENRKAYR